MYLTETRKIDSKELAVLRNTKDNNSRRSNKLSPNPNPAYNDRIGTSTLLLLSKPSLSLRKNTTCCDLSASSGYSTTNLQRRVIFCVSSADSKHKTWVDAVISMVSIEHKQSSRENGWLLSLTERRKPFDVTRSSKEKFALPKSFNLGT